MFTWRLDAIHATAHADINVDRSQELQLVSCSGNTCAKSLKLGEDGFSSGGPSKGFAVLVVMSDEMIDALDQLLDRAEGASADGFVGDEGEEALDLIEPGAVGGNEMQMPA